MKKKDVLEREGDVDGHGHDQISELLGLPQALAFLLCRDFILFRHLYAFFHQLTNNAGMSEGKSTVRFAGAG